MLKPIFAVVIACCLAVPALAGSVSPREGWAVHDTDHSYKEMIDRVKEAAKTGGMGVVTEAGPTEALKSQGIDVPGNRVIGLFHPNYAARVLALSIPAMIEAPIRMYVTENEDGTATLSYKTPSFVFAPYTDEGGAKLEEVAAELDKIFHDIALIAIE